MAYKITDDCVSCGACADACPVGAISEGDGKYVIDADACVECGACAGACPVGAPQEAEFISKQNSGTSCRFFVFYRPTIGDAQAALGMPTAITRVECTFCTDARAVRCYGRNVGRGCGRSTIARSCSTFV